MRIIIRTIPQTIQNRAFKGELLDALTVYEYIVLQFNNPQVGENVNGDVPNPGMGYHKGCNAITHFIAEWRHLSHTFPRA